RHTQALSYAGLWRSAGVSRVVIQAGIRGTIAPADGVVDRVEGIVDIGVAQEPWLWHHSYPCQHPNGLLSRKSRKVKMSVPTCLYRGRIWRLDHKESDMRMNEDVPPDKVSIEATKDMLGRQFAERCWSSKGAPALGQKKFEPVENHEDEKMREDEELAENAGSSGARQFFSKKEPFVLELVLRATIAFEGLDEILIASCWS
ncbi:hypothetical protein GGF50DRAFT_90872, partial [Schizophyllum commune]